MKSLNLIGALFSLSLFLPGLSFSQTFNGVGNLPVPPGAPGATVGITTSDVVVSGVGILGGCSQIDNLTLNLEHTWVGDIAIFLQSPAGSILELSSGNGGSGDNFQITSFSDNATLNIVDGAPPYNGGFKPEGRQQNTNCFCSNANPVETWTFANTFNGENADGTWQLIINDYVAADIGTLNSWSITFTNNGNAPPANPASLEGCGNALGQAVFDLTSVNDIVNGGSGDPVNWFSDPGASSPITDPSSYTSGSGFVYATVGSGACVSAPVTVSLLILPPPTAAPYPLDGCDDGSGTGTFDLTSIENFVNFATGNPVSWFTDAAATNPIADPSSYVSGEGQVWAVVSNGTCSSNPTPIDLNLVPTPNTTNSSITPNPLSLCGPGNVGITFNMPEAGVEFTVQMDYGNPTSGFQSYIGVNVFDGSTVPFVINETTEFILNSVSVENNGFCDVTFADPIVVTVTVNDPPELTLSSTPQICEGESTDLSNFVSTTSGLPITFHSAQPSSPANELPSSEVSPSTTTTYFAFVDGGVGCTAQVPITVTVNTAVAPNLGTDDVCDSETNYDLNQLLDPAFPSGTWSGPGVIGTSFNATGQSGSVVLTFDPDGACATLSTTTILVSPPPPPPLSDTLVSCDDGTGQAVFDLTTIEPLIAGGSTVNWYLDPAGTQAISNPTAFTSPLSTIYATTEQGGCESVSSPIELYFLPALTEGNTFLTIDPQSGCGPTPVNITTNTPSPGEYLVQFYFGNPATSPPFTTGLGIGYGPSGTTLPFLVSENTAFVVNNAVSLFDGVFCFYELEPDDTIVVTVDEPPLNIVLPPTICEGESTDLALAVSNPSGAFLTFHSADPPTPANQLPSTIVNPNVTTVYFALADNGSGCTSTTSIPVTVLPSQVPNLGTEDICETETNFNLTQLADPSFPGGTWSGPGVAGNIFVATGLSGPITLTFDPVQACAEEATTIVTVVTSLTPQLGTAQICESSAPIPLTPLADPAFPLGTWNGPGVNGGTFSPTGLNGEITLVFDPDEPCAETVTTTITIDDQPDLIQVLFPEICESESFDLSTAALTNSGLAITFHSAEPPTPANTLPSSIVNPNVTTTYFAFVDGGGDCTTTLPLTVNVNPSIVPNLTNGSICESETFFDLTSLQDPAFSSGTWSGPGVNGNLFFPSGLSGTINLTFTSDEICIQPATTEMAIEVEAFPVLGTASTCSSETNFNLNTLLDPAFPLGNWNGPGVNGNNFNATGLSGNITLTFQAGGDCVSLATTTIQVDEAVFPNLENAAVCESETNFDLTNLIDPTFPNGTWSGPGVSGNSFSAVSLNGNVNLTFTPDDDCSQASNTTINILPFLQPNLSEGAVCGNETLDLNTLVNPSFPLGTWSGPGVNGSVFSPVGLSGNITLTFTPDEDCADSATTIVAINEAPQVVDVVANCNAQNTLYTLSFSISGGDPTSYAVNGVPNSTFFSSDPIPSGDTYFFEVEDGNTCGPVVVSGSFNCDCATFAGTMNLSGSPFELCSDDSFLAIANLDEVLDLNDVLQFVLHDNAGPSLGNILAVNDIPEFSFPTGGLLGETYYVSAVAANDDGTGNFDPNDACLSVSAGVPVVFYESTATIGNGGGVCGNTCFDIPFTFEGVAPFEIFYSVSTPDILANESFVSSQETATITICPDDWNVESGDIIISPSAMIDANGCTFSFPNTSQANVSVQPEVTFELEQVLCIGETLQVGGEVFSGANPSGSVIFPNGAFNGCDSVVNVSLSFAPEASFLLNPTLCVGTGVTVNGTFYNQLNPSGIEILPNASVNGCDSTVTIALSFDNVVSVILNPTLCPGESVEVNGIIYDESNPNGTELFENGASSGCDSLVEIDLIFAGPASGQISQSLCSGESIEVNGTVYDESNPSGTELFPNASVNGCDSTVVISLSFDDVVSFNLNPTFCSGESIEVNGTVYDEANPTGTELFENGASSGCDSLVEINLTFEPAANSVLQPTLCFGESIEVNGTIYDESNPAGVETLEGASANGCDSFVIVSLTFDDLVTFQLSETLCADGSLTVNGTTYDASNPTGTELFENGAVSGCDSLVEISLAFYEIPIGTLQPILCFGETFFFNGEFYDSSNPSGTAILPGAASTGCDSAVLVNLQFGPPTVGELNATLCAGEFEILQGQIFDASNPSGQVVFPNANVFGCDSTVNVNLTFLPELISELNDTLPLDGSLEVNGVVYDIDNPTGEEIFLSASFNGCDSTVQVNLVFIDEELIIDAFSQPTTCFGFADGQLIIENISGGSGTYFVSLNNQPSIPINNFPFVFDNLPPGSFTLMVSDDTGLTNTLSIEVLSPPEIVVELGNDETINLGESINLNAVSNIVPSQIIWEPTELLDCDFCLNPLVVQPIESISYFLTISDENGCTASDEIEIIVRKARNVYVPNAFSPNGDGINDEITVFAGDEVTSVRTFQIYDRWGGAVFEAFDFRPNDPSLGWNGIYKGELMNAAVFVFFAEVEFLDGEVVLVKGEVNLVR